MWFPKFPYTNFSQINLDWVLKQVKELSEWMNRYFKQIRQDLDDEINNRIEGDKALGERIDKEITDRTEADQQLQENINAEEAAREAADQQLQNNIDAEEAAREAADQQLQNNIDAEEAAREAADTALGGRIDKEIQDRTEADTALGQRIDTETAERKAADQQLQSNIDAEESAREAADQQLQTNINTLRNDAILKNGSTTTTAAIPFAQGIKTGSIAELSPDSGVSIESQLDLNSHKITALANGTENTDAVNLGQMNTADVQAVQEAVEEANSYTDSQLEAFAADVHSIPSGGNSGQVLAKVDGTNYNVTWVDQQGGESGGDVPAGGTTGQVLAKATDADYQTEWVDPTAGPEGPQGEPGPQGPTGPAGPGVAAGGTTGQMLSKVDSADYNTQWIDPPSDFTLVSSTTNIGWYINPEGIKMMVVNKFLTIPINSGYGSKTIEAPPDECVPVDGLINITGVVNVSASGFTLAGITINSSATTINAYTTIPTSSAIGLRRGLVIFYK